MSHMKNRDGNRQRREDRQIQASVRQELRAGRSTSEQIARLDAGGYVAKKERARLLTPAHEIMEKGGGFVPGYTTVFIAKVKKPHRNDKKAQKALARKENVNG
jgi:hypothetical protein